MTELSKTWQARDIHGRVGTWRLSPCGTCHALTPTLVGMAGRPECVACTPEEHRQDQQRAMQKILSQRPKP